MKHLKVGVADLDGRVNDVYCVAIQQEQALITKARQLLVSLERQGKKKPARFSGLLQGVVDCYGSDT